MATEGEPAFKRIEHVPRGHAACRIFIENRVGPIDYPGFPRNAHEMEAAFGAALESASYDYGKNMPPCALMTFELRPGSKSKNLLAKAWRAWCKDDNRWTAGFVERSLRGKEAESLLTGGGTFAERKPSRTDDISFPLYFVFSRSRKRSGKHWYEIEVYREGGRRCKPPKAKADGSGAA